MIEIPYESKDTFVEKVSIRSKKRGWDISSAKLLDLGSQLSSCADSDLSWPLSISFRFEDLNYTLYEYLRWLSSEAEKLGYGFRDYTRSYRKNDPITGKLVLPLVLRDSATFVAYDLKAAKLDLKSFWGKPYDNNFLANRLHWPSFEILAMLALNPKVIPLINGVDLPYLILPGLVIDHRYYLKISFDGKNLNVCCVWGADSWHDTSLPCYSSIS